MSGYDFIRPVLMRLDPEFGHKRALQALKNIARSRTLTALEEKSFGNKVPNLPVKVMGKTFTNPVGLAAGFDKDAVAFPSLSGIGFGCVELGTVTPNPQRGNPKKRIFRVVDDEAIINRLGFNSSGLHEFIANLKNTQTVTKSAVLGINIGKNTDTPNDNAITDYLHCLEGVYDLADYIVLNVSSPNSPGLRDLQNVTYLNELLEAVMQRKVELFQIHSDRAVPVAIKISPDLNNADLISITEAAAKHSVDAIIATNTTVTRPKSCVHRTYSESGGLSGKPLAELSTQAIRTVSEVSDHSIPIIGVGGIFSAEDAWKKFMAGASLVQIYSSLIYRGPSVVREIVTGLSALANQYDSKNFSSAVVTARNHQ